MRNGLTIVVLLLAAVLSGCGGGQAPGPVADDRSDAGTPTAGRPSGTTPVPDELTFAGTTVDGKRFDAASIAGRPVVLWFWAPWCPKCKAGAPDVQAAADRHGADVTVIGVGGLGRASEMKAFVDDAGLSFVNLADESGAVWRRFGVTTQHTFVLLEADGTVVHRGGLSGEELTRELAALAG